MLQTPMGGAASPHVVPRLLKVGDVAERLGVSTATVYALCKGGSLQHVRVANAIRVPDSALEEFLASNDALYRRLGRSPT